MISVPLTSDIRFGTAGQGRGHTVLSLPVCSAIHHSLPRLSELPPSLRLLWAVGQQLTPTSDIAAPSSEPWPHLLFGILLNYRRKW